MSDSRRAEPGSSEGAELVPCAPLGRRRLVGLAAIADAFEREACIPILYCPRGELAVDEAALVARARARGIVVRIASERERLRLSEGTDAARLLALEGPKPEASLEELMARGGLVLVLVGLRYPGNVGFIVRAAEVAGAAGVVVCESWTRAERASAMRFAMQADRFMPVVDASPDAATRAARGAGRRLVALETEGRAAPWEERLAGPLAVFLGAEAEGVPQAVLDEMDAILRIPMRGFIPSYNVQAAAAIVLGEWLRRAAD